MKHEIKQNVKPLKKRRKMTDILTEDHQIDPDIDDITSIIDDDNDIEVDDYDTDDETKIAAEIIKAPAEEWLVDQYLPYAVYVIRSRALIPDDGLKPVNRRILYALFKEGITPSSKYLKAARAAANAVAFHPHGNASIEDALARMAQSFNMRIPLIEPYGSVGKAAGDTAAAARYWEARLTKAAMELLRELPDGSVPFGRNFDGELDEPYALPIRWPNNIINGTEGIAVGYASKMFPHNPDEVMDAVVAKIKNPDLTVDELMKIMPGPDFPSGGEIFGVDGIKEYYETGKGTFVLRGRYEIENLPRGKVNIVFHELPFQTSAESIIKRIQSLQEKGNVFNEIASVKDLSGKNKSVKLVIETKAGTNFKKVVAELFSMTPLEQKMPVNATVLIDNTPVKSSMLNLFERFIDFRRVCYVNRSKTRIGKANARIHQLDAVIAALIDIDKCIAIIRNSDGAEIARNDLMAAFGVDKDQADYILSMQLRRLTKSDSISLENEKSQLLEEINRINEVLNDRSLMDKEIIKEIEETKKIISSPRMTIITGMTTEELKDEAKVVAQAAKENSKNVVCHVTRFASGLLVKTMEPWLYEPHVSKLDNSPVVESIKVNSQDDIVLVDVNGNGYRTPLSYLPFDKVCSISDTGVKMSGDLVAIAKGTPVKSDVGLAMATKNGEVKVCTPDLPKKTEFVVFNLSDGDEIIGAKWIGNNMENLSFVSITDGSNILTYNADSVRVSGAPAGGVRSQKLREGESVIFWGVVDNAKKNSTIVVSQSNMTLKATLLSEIPPKGKGSQGVLLHKFNKGETKLVNAFAGDDIAISVDKLNNVIPLPALTKRAASGEKIGFKTNMGSRSVESL